MAEVNYLFITIAAFIAIGSPGPATLAISGASMSRGRKEGLLLALGVLTGSLFWSISAAFGLGTLLYTNAWLFEILRYLGALYLLFLAHRAFRSALTKSDVKDSNGRQPSFEHAYFRGLFIHLSNPKAIVFFGSLYSVGLPNSVTTEELLLVISTVGIVSSIIFIGYSFLFSIPKVRFIYSGSRRVFESVFAALFGVAGVKILVGGLDR